MTLPPIEAEGVELIYPAPLRDLGDGFAVRRALPSAHRRMVGPFIFVDQMGPAAFRGGQGLDVRPHPHIGLATITYLIEGEMLHRDSLGSVQSIRPGEVNLMTAGAGIVHSERTPPDVRASGGPLFGLQTWIALPTAHEEMGATFAHHGAAELPHVADGGVDFTLIVGSADGLVSPVKVLSDMVYAQILLAPGARYQVATEHVERALYVVEGTVEIVGQPGSFAAGELVVFKPGAEIVLRGIGQARLALFGGEPFPEGRHIYWNFVSSSRERIEQAKEDWRAQRFAPVAEEHEFIPLPADPPGVRIR